MPAGIFIRPFILLFGIAWLATARGAELTDVQLRDGLTKLVAFVGGEVPRDARWVQVESPGQRFGIFTKDADVFNSVGNAFLFGEKPGEEARIVVLFRGDVFSIKAERAEIRSREDASFREYRGKWKEVEVSKDVDIAVEWLRREAAKVKKAEPADPFGALGTGDPDNPAALFDQHQQTALLWAAILLHTGHEEEALKLARPIFRDADATRRQQLLDGLFGRLAQNGWLQAMRAFAVHADWGRLRDQLDALVKKFPMGWSGRDAVRVFLQAVTERAKLPAEPPLKTKLPLPAADQESLLTWLKEQESGKFSGYSRWTLPALPDADDGPGKAMGYTAFPRSHGPAAVPILAALLADDTLTVVGVEAADRDTGYMSSWDNVDPFGHREIDAADKLRAMYRYLPKPSTRADLAWHLLQQVLPNELRSGGEADLAERANDILAWYGSVKDLAPPDLALKYLEGGLNDADILAHAFATTDPKKIAQLENVMVDQADVYSLNSLDPFITKLGAKAPAFLGKVRQKLEEELTRYGDGQDRLHKQMEKGLKRLDALAKGELKKPDLPALIAMMAAFDPAIPEEDQTVAQEAFVELPKLLKNLTLQAKLEAIVPVLPDFKSSRMAEYMMQLVFMEENGSKLKPEDGLAALEKTKSHWKRLLERSSDPDQAPSDPDGEDVPQGLLIRTVACLQLLVTGEADDEAASYLAALGTRGTRVLRDHGMALLDGKTPPPLPKAAAVNPEMRQQLLKEWSNKSVENIAKDIETLEIDKLLVLNEALTHETELPPNFTAYMDQIRGVTLSGVKELGGWQALRGRKLDKATAIEIARRVSSFEGSSSISVQLQRPVPVMGWKLIVKESSSLSKGWQSESLRSTALGIGEALPKLAKRACQGTFTRGNHQLSWTWFDAPITEAPKEEVSPEVKQADEALAEAWVYMGEVRREELHSWESVLNALEQENVEPSYLHFISISTTGIPKTE